MAWTPPSDAVEVSQTEPTSGWVPPSDAIEATAQQPQQSSSGMLDKLTSAETWFGEGPQKEMDWPQRLRRFGEATGAGGLIGAGIGSVVPGIGTFAGGATGMLGGALGEIGEQVAAKADIGRGGQVLTGMLAGAPAGIADALTTAGRGAAKAVASVIPGTSGFALRRFINEVAAKEGLDPSVVQAVRAAQQRLAEGGEQASREFGQATQKAFGSEKTAYESAAQEARKRAEDFASQVNTSQNQKQQLYYTQAEQANRQLADTLEQGIGKGSSGFDLGSRIRTTVESINNPIAQQRSREYKEAADKAFESARASEESGNYWSNTEGAKAVFDKWKEIASRSSTDVKNQINAVINDIWKKEPIKNEWGETIGYKDKPLSAEGIDQIVRRLGEAHTKDVAGYDALKGSLAKELRRDITKGIDGGGFYDWSGLGEAKSAFKAASENLSRFESKRGQSLLEKQFGIDIYKDDAETLTRKMLGSESGVKEFLKMVQDPKVVSDHLEDYVRGQISGKSPAQAQKWLDANKYVEDYIQKPIRQEITDYVGKAGILERQANQFTQAAKTSSKSTLSPFVNKSAQGYVDKLGITGADGTMMDANKILDNLLSSKFSGAKMQEVGRLIGDQPGMKDNMMNAVALRLSGVSPHRVMAEFDALEPAIRGFRGVGEQDIAQMKARLQQVVDSAQKNPKIQQTGNFKKALLGFGARSTGRSLLRPMITGRIDTEVDKNEQR